MATALMLKWRKMRRQKNAENAKKSGTAQYGAAFSKLIS
jgi:hypothetical protein